MYVFAPLQHMHCSHRIIDYLEFDKIFINDFGLFLFTITETVETSLESCEIRAIFAYFTVEETEM